MQVLLPPCNGTKPLLDICGSPSSAWWAHQARFPGRQGAAGLHLLPRADRKAQQHASDQHCVAGTAPGVQLTQCDHRPC